jgi:hypothetical protein
VQFSLIVNYLISSLKSFPTRSNISAKTN